MFLKEVNIKIILKKSEKVKKIELRKEKVGI
jgi:hypothetical protein